MVYSKQLCLVLILCSYFIGCNSSFEHIKVYFKDVGGEGAGSVYDKNATGHVDDWKNSTLFFTGRPNFHLHFRNGELEYWETKEKNNNYLETGENIKFGGELVKMSYDMTKNLCKHYADRNHRIENAGNEYWKAYVVKKNTQKVKFLTAMTKLFETKLE
jgi:hypothetical protein